MSAARERIQAGGGRVQHAGNTGARTEEPAGPEPRRCARCQLPFPFHGSRRARYCSATCRHADVRERRAAAYDDLIDAVGQLARAANRIQQSLRVMGFLPSRRRARAWHATYRNPHSSANLASPPAVTGNTWPAFPSKSTKNA